MVKNKHVIFCFIAMKPPLYTLNTIIQTHQNEIPVKLLLYAEVKRNDGSLPKSIRSCDHHYVETSSKSHSCHCQRKRAIFFLSSII